MASRERSSRLFRPIGLNGVNLLRRGLYGMELSLQDARQPVVGGVAGGFGEVVIGFGMQDR